MTPPVVIDLNALSQEANEWLRAQPSGRALDPAAIEYFRRRFCLPAFIWDCILREEEKGA